MKQSQNDQQQVVGGSNFRLQLFQRTLEGTLDSFQNSVHDDMRNLHIEILRQFHMHEVVSVFFSPLSCFNLTHVDLKADYVVLYRWRCRRY